MFTTMRPILSVLLGVACLELGLAAMSPLVSLQLARHAVATELIGLIQSAFFAGFLLGTVTCHRAIDRVGHTRAYSAFAAVSASVTLLHTLSTEPYLWLALRVVLGYAIAGQFVIVESWLNDKATTENRGRVFALYTTLAWGAGGLAPLALNLPDRGGHLLFTIMTVLMTISIVPLSLTTVGHPDSGQRNHFGIARLYRISPLGVFTCFASGFVNTPLFNLLPVYTEGKGFTTAELSLLLSLSTVGALLCQYPIGMLADRFGRRPLMLASSLLATLSSAAMLAFERPSYAVLLGLIALTATMTAPLYALGVGQTNDYVSKKDFVAASAGLLFAWALGASLGPTIAAALIGALGPAGLFLFVAGSMLAVVVFILIRMAARRALSLREQSHYVPLPLTQGTQGAPELDPRAQPLPTEGTPPRLP